MIENESSKWDSRFLKLAREVASWSKDPSTRVGAVIVRPDRTVASVGFNGFPRKCSDDVELYLDRETKLSRIIHAEMNAILHAKERVDGYTLYVWPPSPSPACCDRCAAHVIQAGITRIVHVEGDEIASERWKAALDSSQRMFDEAEVEISTVPISELLLTGNWPEARDGDLMEKSTDNGVTCDHAGCGSYVRPGTPFCDFHHDHEDAPIGNPPQITRPRR